MNNNSQLTSQIFVSNSSAYSVNLSTDSDRGGTSRTNAAASLMAPSDHLEWLIHPAIKNTPENSRITTCPLLLINKSLIGPNMPQTPVPERGDPPAWTNFPFPNDNRSMAGKLIKHVTRIRPSTPSGTRFSLFPFHLLFPCRYSRGQPKTETPGRSTPCHPTLSNHNDYKPCTGRPVHDLTNLWIKCTGCEKWQTVFDCYPITISNFAISYNDHT